MDAMGGTTISSGYVVAPIDGGLRERKKLRTRQALIDAAFDLFARKGFEATTVEEIAEAVEVSSRTFFRYFPTKEDVVLTVFEEQFALMVAAFEARPPDEPVLTALGNAAGAMLVTCEQGLDGIAPERFECAQQLAMDSPSLFARVLEHASAKQEDMTRRIADRMGVDPGSDFRPHLVASVAIFGIRAATDSWRKEHAEVSPADMVGATVELLASGIDYPSTAVGNTTAGGTATPATSGTAT
jgi:AcrR family transcriptional regulator